MEELYDDLFQLKRNKNKKENVYVLNVDIPACPKGTRFVKTNDPFNYGHYVPEGEFFPVFAEEDLKNSPDFDKE